MLGPERFFFMGDILDNSLDSRVPSAVGVRGVCGGRR